MSTTTPGAANMISVRITPAVALDICSREISEKPFCNITDPGTYGLFPEEAAALLADADYYGNDADGPGQSLTFGQRRAYASLAKQLRDAGVEMPALVFESPEERGRRNVGGYDLWPDHIEKLLDPALLADQWGTGVPDGLAVDTRTPDARLTDEGLRVRDLLIAEGADASPLPARPALVPIESLPAGAPFRHKTRRLTVDTDQAGAENRQYVFVAGGERGMAIAHGTLVLPL